LSLRLFGNIFAWMILISVIWFLWLLMSEHFFQIGRLLTVPFWFFEIFVAFVQAIVFAWLMIAYFRQSIEWDH
jgi:F0F1-type ATP synthase membrane subunit a